MRRLTWVVSCLIIVGLAAADEPAPTAKKAGPQADVKENVKTKAKGKAAAGSQGAAVAAKSKTARSTDPRATSLLVSAQNLEKTGKKTGAIGLYRDLLIKYPDSLEAPEATIRLQALGGKVPDPSEIKPAPPAEKTKLTRAPKPRYASQEANRAALDQSLGGMIQSAATPPPATGPYGK
jgi:hypothetical protein